MREDGGQNTGKMGLGDRLTGKRRTYFFFVIRGKTNGQMIVKTGSLSFGRKAMANLDSILKSRDITLPTKVCIVKAMVFPVVMYECELGHKES